MMLATAGIGMFLASCQSASNDVDDPPPTAYAPPVVQPLKFGKAVKINWDSIKATPVHPLVKPFDWDKLPAQSYDTAGFKPSKYPVEEKTIDFDKLPEKDLDIDQLPSEPLKLITTRLPPPKQIKAGPPHLKNAVLSLYQLEESQGLHGYIRYLLTDREGFLWIATTLGIYRYDGENLLLYQSLPDYQVCGMIQDTLGRIWISNFGSLNDSGLEILDPVAMTLKKPGKSLGLGANTVTILKDKAQRIWVTAGKTHRFGIIDVEQQTIKWLDNIPRSVALIQDKSGNIWLQTHAGAIIINPVKKKIKFLNKANGLTADTTGILFCDSKGNIWMGMPDSQLDVLNVQQNKMSIVKDARYPGNFIWHISEDHNGMIWVATVKGVEVIDPAKHTARNLKKADGLAGDWILNTEEDKQGQQWMASFTGLNMIDNNDVIIDHIGKNTVGAIMEDKEERLWSSTTSGLTITDRKTKTFKSISTRQGLADEAIQHFATYGGKIFICTDNGINIIDSGKTTLTTLGVKQGLSYKRPEYVMPDKSGNIWIGYTNGIDVYNPQNNTLKNLGKNRGMPDGFVNDMKVDKQGLIWINSQRSVYRLNPVTWEMQKLSLTGEISILLCDSSGNTWIGTSSGIYIANSANKTLTSFSTAQGLIEGHISSLLAYNNQIYAGTYKGITIITPAAPGKTAKPWKTASFGRQYGLDKISLRNIRSDAITRDGLYCWGDSGITVLDFTKKSQYIPPVYMTGINVMDEQKYFSGNQQEDSAGLSWTDPDQLPVNLQLPYSQNFRQFKYADLNLAIHDTALYCYKLIGVDKKWNGPTASTTSKGYFSVAPGKYTFEVVGKTSDNGWGKPVSLSFTINPPWRQSWWAYMLYAVLFAGVIWGVVTLRSRQLVKEKRILEHKVHIRTEEVIQQKEEIESQRDNLEKAFSELKTTQTQLIQSEKMASLGELTAGIAHEIQNPLNFVNNFSEVNKEMLEELKAESEKPKAERDEQLEMELINDLIKNEEKINHHGKRADGIVKGMLQHSRTAGGEKTPTNINSVAEEYMRLSYHGLRAKDKSFNAEMIVKFDPELPRVQAVGQDIGRVFLNLFNNAFYAVNLKKKTAGPDYQPEVTVITAFKSGSVRIVVKDNGVGIPDAIKDKIMQPFFTTKPTGEGTGLGLSLTYEMVLKGHGGRIEVNSKEGEFTEFTITLPL